MHRTSLTLLSLKVYVCKSAQPQSAPAARIDRARRVNRLLHEILERQEDPALLIPERLKGGLSPARRSADRGRERSERTSWTRASYPTDSKIRKAVGIVDVLRRPVHKPSRRSASIDGSKGSSHLYLRRGAAHSRCWSTGGTNVWVSTLRRT
ncbi:hypothetical protein B0H14DRAFT_958849 [Mycena olivaceomarginata]|nr:hypothetical protein B0H14DRAFT_958849 [Mycena olivaceomarginata]